MPPGRPPPIRPEKTRQAALEIVDQLLELAAKTDDPASAADKDHNAFFALELLSYLAPILTQWAIDHQTGLALHGLKFVPLYPHVRKDPDYLAARAAVDDHGHERAGFAHRRPSLVVAPEQRRRALINLLRPGRLAFPWGLIDDLVDALEALEFGEVKPLLQPVRKGRKANLSELQMQLKAQEFVAYRRAADGETRARAGAAVAEAYGVDAETVATWRKRLALELGPLRVKAAEAYARNIGVTVRERRLARLAGKEPAAGHRDWSLAYGDEALREAGRRYRELKRS